MVARPKDERRSWNCPARDLTPVANCCLGGRPARARRRVARREPWRRELWRSAPADSPWIATRKLVDSLAEQELLEKLLEGAKPPAPGARVHYLLSTPFRYPPLPHGSRFGRATERGIVQALRYPSARDPEGA